MSVAYGCKLSKIDLRDYKIKASATSTLPDEFKLDFKHNIKNQNAISSCVAHSTSEILEYYGGVNMSTNFIYSIRNKLFGSTGRGMYLVEACKIVQQYGDMIYEDCPGNIEAPGCFKHADAMLSNKEKLDRAYYYRIDSYYGCDTDNDIKAAIMNYGPVLAAVKWYENYNVDTNGILTFDTESKYNYHAIMIYGWNKEGFIFQNSWGLNFGKDGCAIIPYQYGIAEARCLVDHDNNLDDEQLVKPKLNKVTKILCKIINKIINIFLGRK